MGGMGSFRNEKEPQDADCAFGSRSKMMTDDREKIGTGQNDRPIDETVAGTGPGIPDDALAPGEDALPEPPTDEQAEEAAEALGAPQAEVDTLPLDGE